MFVSRSMTRRVITVGPETTVFAAQELKIGYVNSERVLREILDSYPQADMFTLIDARDDELRAAISRPATATSFLQSFPRPRRWLRYYVPLMPLAMFPSWLGLSTGEP